MTLCLDAKPLLTHLRNLVNTPGNIPGKTFSLLLNPLIFLPRL